MGDRPPNRKDFDMDDQRFDSIMRLAAHGPDRRNMLKLAGAAAVVGTAGFLAHAEDAEAKTMRGARKVAAQICAAVEAMNSLGSNGSFTCTYPGQ